MSARKLSSLQPVNPMLTGGNPRRKTPRGGPFSHA
jgi:hypothetical protein